MRLISFLALLVFVLTPVIHAGQSLPASQARQHVGEHATVCGTVASGHHAVRSKGQPTFLNLDKPYPDQVFTIVISGDDRAKFGNPERALLNRHVCVSGDIREYRGTPEIIATEKNQIVEK